MRKWLNIKLFSLIIGFFLLSTVAWADTSQLENTLYEDKAKIVAEQIEILKNRLAQAKNEVHKLQTQQESRPSLSIDPVNKQMLNQAGLNISIAQSNLDSIGIELAESQQTISRLENDTQELENQINIYGMFGLKVESHASASNVDGMQQDLNYQKNILQLEKTRAEYLTKLQALANTALQYYKNRYARVEMLLKSQTVTQLKEQQFKSEIGFQQEQSYWLQQLNTLYAQLNTLSQQKQDDRVAYAKLENEIFYANENVNFSYLQMLIARYQDQIRQLKISVSHSSSITLLNNMLDQAQLLGKQLDRAHDLLKNRISILEKRKNFLAQNKDNESYVTGLVNLNNQYIAAEENVENLSKQLIAFRLTLDQALQQELSSRQGLPGFGAKAWLDLGAELLLVPTLTFQVVKSLVLNTSKSFQQIDLLGWTILAVLEMVWIGAVSLIGYLLKKLIAGVPDHEFGHINLKWLLIKVTERNLISIGIIGNLAWLFPYSGVPAQNYSFLINFACVCLIFKIMQTTARLCLVETVHDRAGHDVRLYYRLKWAFLVGGIITAFTVFIHQLPLIYEVKDLFIRLFLLSMLIVSIFLLKSWEVVPGLILPHVDEKHTYVKRVVRLLGLLIPVILLVNSAIGLFGFVNLVLSISWYESIFLLVMVSYLFVRGLLNDAMQYLSQLVIRHFANGWLWTEAFLKPIDKVLRMGLILLSCVALFAFYGWDRQSPVVMALNKAIHYQLIDMLNTSITTLSILELAVVVSILFWAARWTREFVYRLLLSRTKDLGIRNSIAILSQYTVILIGVFICLRVLGIDFRALTVVAGAFAFGVGLGLRDLVNNFACGFLLLLERPLRVGDTVTINGIEGEVMHIGGRAVTIRTWDHMELLVPNAEIFSKTFLNWTANDHIVRTVITIKINRHDKPQDVQNIIYQVLGAHKDVLSDPAPEVYLKELKDEDTEFEVRYYVNLRQVKSRIAVRSEVLVAVWETFEKHGIQPPYPHREILLKNHDVRMLRDVSIT